MGTRRRDASAARRGYLLHSAAEVHECVGFFDHEECAAACPVDCCIPDPDNPETEDALLERARQMHPEVIFGTDFPSRFSKA